MIQLVLLAFLPTVFGDSYCLAKDDNPYVMYGEKTSYSFVHGIKPDPYIANCRPLQLWFITKHGSLLPSEKEINTFNNLRSLRDQILTNHKQRNGELCKEDLDNLQKWTVKYDLKKSNKLMGQGEVDMLSLGERLRTTFSDLLNTTYTPQQFIFQSSPTPKIELSELGLALGIFDEELVSKLEDDFNQPLPNCALWFDQKYNSWDRREVNKFEKSDVVKSMIDRVSQRLGFSLKQSSGYVNMSSLMSMWAVCAYDRAREYKAVSPWCAAFKTEDLKIMEYYEDLVYYYSMGNNQEALFKMGCPLLTDMIDSFSQLTLNTTDLKEAVKGTFYVVDNTTLLALLYRMGIGQPEKPLTSDNYLEMADREWRTSKLIPASGNLAATFYKCDNGQYKVKFFQNEKILKYPGCDDKGVCDWKLLADNFKNIIEPSSCNYNFCSSGEASPSKA